MMAVLCPHCGEKSLDEEDEVCHNCGVVSEGFQLDDTWNPFNSDTKTTLHKWPQKKITVGLDYGISMLNMLSHKYSVSADIKANACDLLKEAYATKFFKNRLDVGVLAGCCLIHLLKQNKIYVTIVDLCKKLKCAKKLAFRYSKFLRDHLNKQAKSLAVDIKPDVVEMTFEVKLDFSVKTFLESVLVEDKDKLIAKTIDLTKLAHSCWLISGRSPEGVICASSFLCWKSMHPSRQNFSFVRFCKEFSIPYQKALPRVSEIKDMLLKLGRKIPSFTENYVTEKNVLLHLDYILAHSETLRNDLLTNEFTTEEVDKKEFSSFRRVFTRISKRQQLLEMEIKTECKHIKTEYKDDMNASDIEISDTEISSYIRSDEQVEMIKSLKEKSLAMQIIDSSVL